MYIIESTELSRLIRQPFDIYKPGYVDTYILGMANQLAQAMDEGVTEEVRKLNIENVFAFHFIFVFFTRLQHFCSENHINILEWIWQQLIFNGEETMQFRDTLHIEKYADFLQCIIGKIWLE
jgi:hypothetical protein